MNSRVLCKCKLHSVKVCYSYRIFTRHNFNFSISILLLLIIEDWWWLKDYRIQELDPAKPLSLLFYI